MKVVSWKTVTILKALRSKGRLQNKRTSTPYSPHTATLNQLYLGLTLTVDSGKALEHSLTNGHLQHLQPSSAI